MLYTDKREKEEREREREDRRGRERNTGRKERKTYRAPLAWACRIPCCSSAGASSSAVCSPCAAGTYSDSSGAGVWMVERGGGERERERMREKEGVKGGESEVSGRERDQMWRSHWTTGPRDG